jgi:hypothetical protein
MGPLTSRIIVPRVAAHGCQSNGAHPAVHVVSVWATKRPPRKAAKSGRHTINTGQLGMQMRHLRRYLRKLRRPARDQALWGKKRSSSWPGIGCCGLRARRSGPHAGSSLRRHVLRESFKGCCSKRSLPHPKSSSVCAFTSFIVPSRSAMTIASGADSSNPLNPDRPANA